MTHHLTEIREHSNKNKWHYIPSKINVADDRTRPIKFEEFHTNCRYLYGQTFLRGSELPVFSCSDDNCVVSLSNINLDTKYLKEDETNQKKGSNFIFWKRF